MHRCRVAPELLDGEKCRLPRDASHHLRTVLRVKPGEEVHLLDGQGRRRRSRIASVDRDAVCCEACGRVETLPRTGPELTLFQCVAKGPRMDWLVEKAVELGAAELVPVLSASCVARYAEGERVARWDRIADSALEQCGGAWALRILPVQGWTEALERARGHSRMLAAVLVEGAMPLAQALESWRGTPIEDAAWFVGPEGDFTEEEIAGLRHAGALPVSLGERILRTETAAMLGLCALSLAGQRGSTSVPPEDESRRWPSES